MIDTKQCGKCGERKPLDEFHRRTSAPDGRQGKCKSCSTKISSARYAANKDAINAQNYAYKRNNPERITRITRSGRLRRIYGITQEGFDALLASQGGGCAVCGVAACPTGIKSLVVDHDHKTGEVRGILCTPCNRAIGCMKDDPSRLLAASEYLRRESPTAILRDSADTPKPRRSGRTGTHRRR